jgi:type II secretory ATPase GspE/PulE/Tfp pilus assembly ATPase PilB-like protein
MTLLAFTDLLAALPVSFTFVSWPKLVGVVVLFTLWALLAQWVDKDTVAVNTYRIFWNLIAVGVGTGTAAALLLVPAFLIGTLIQVVAVGTLAIVYVLHRNALVREDDKVLTAAHLKRVFTEGFSRGGKKKVKEVKEKVRIRGANGKYVTIPPEDPEREQYRLMQDLLWDVLWTRAAHAEIAPGKEVCKVGYEVDGIPAEREPLPRAEADGIIAFMKGIAGLSLEEKRKPQTGRVRVYVGENQLEVEVRTDGSTVGEKLTLRVIGEESRYKVTDLGFTPRQLELVQQFMQAPKGLVLLSGPHDAGLTTTVYSFTRSHDAFLHNIQTLELRRELAVDNVTQQVFEPAENKTFAGEVQRLFRTDPDIVVLPEVRDQASAVIATDAALAKQLVYVGLSAADVFGALRKWLELVTDFGKVGGSLLAITNQRLVRMLCPSCKQPYKPDPALLKKLNLPADAVFHRQPEPEYDKRGNPIICQHCQGSGYVGRTGVFDLLAVDEELRGVIRKARSVDEIQTFAAKRGGLGFQTHALQKVLDGTTSIQEVTRVLRGGKPEAAKGGGKAPAGKAPSGRAN